MFARDRYFDLWGYVIALRWRPGSADSRLKVSFGNAKPIIYYVTRRVQRIATRLNGSLSEAWQHRFDVFLSGAVRKGRAKTER